MPKYIEFHRDVQDYAGREVYIILNKRSKAPLGNVLWHPHWKQWVCRMDEDAVWSHDCLADVRSYLLELNQSQPATR